MCQAANHLRAHRIVTIQASLAVALLSAGRRVLGDTGKVVRELMESGASFASWLGILFTWRIKRLKLISCFAIVEKITNLLPSYSICFAILSAEIDSLSNTTLVE